MYEFPFVNVGFGSENVNSYHAYVIGYDWLNTFVVAMYDKSELYSAHLGEYTLS